MSFSNIAKSSHQKQRQAWFQKNFSLYSIVGTATTMMKFCGITESHF